jgi:long-subunit fatty acid transport protein
MKTSRLLALLFALALPNSTFASGFEKSIPWGGKTSGTAGIGAPDLLGSQALFFNPANLAGEEDKSDVSVNVSPTQAKFQGPILTATAQESAETTTLFPFGLTYGRSGSKLGFGVGTYISGGTHSKYTDYVKSPIPGSFEVKTELTIMEAAAGVGYRVTDNLKLGASWRVVRVTGALSTIIPASATTYDQIDLKDLEDTNYLGFKLGGQYKLGENTDLGFTYRSGVTFEAEGTMGGTRHIIPGTVATITDTPVKVGTELPPAWSLSVSNRSCENWRLLGEYTFTEYSRVTNLAVSTSSTSSPIQLQWKDQHNFRVGAEYKRFSWPVRMGYVWTSQVTPHDHAYPTMVPPSHADTFTLGTGHEFGSFAVNVGAEYTKMKGNSSSQAADYAVTEYALHTGATYSF